MADISFDPSFRHTPWVDNRDRVQAGGPNGFNVRFDALEADLQALSGVVSEIDAALDLLGQTPAAVAQVLTLPPMLSPTSTSGPWALDINGYAVRPAPQTSIAGITPAVIPDGVQLSAFRASGVNSGAGTLRISLMRGRLLGGPTPADRLARVTGDANPFDNSVNVDPQLALVDTLTFRYFVLAQLDNAQTADVVSLSGFQITYLA
ncbi:MAG TPA: hypothetical protein VFN19_11315 [Candidatus Nanopelagicales bacterium]|nr:hypothetical protein [Candidatus Nanopelagicales bacterium]